jgi:CrcB protein
LDRLFWICLGSAVGGGARYLVSLWALRALGDSFPYGTLLVNVSGSFAMAALMYAGMEAAAISPLARLALTTGVMGGFTTYSAFSYETLRYLQAGALGVAVANLAFTLAGCLVASLLGFASARALLG